MSSTSIATPSVSKRPKTPSTAQPLSIRTRSMASSSSVVNKSSRRSLPPVKGRRALDLKTINRRYDEEDGNARAKSTKNPVCRGEEVERPQKQARRRSPVKSKGKERMKELLGDDSEMAGATSEEDVAEELKPARFLPIPPRSPIDARTSSALSNPFHPRGTSALQRSYHKYADVHMGSDDSSTSSDDSMLLMPSPKKVAASPLKPSSLYLSSVVPSSGIKRSRARAFEDSSKAPSPKKFILPKTPTIDVANPFYVSPAPRQLPPPAIASTSTSDSSIAANSIHSSPITSSISSTINSLSIRTPQSQKKRAREVFSGSHQSPEEGAVPIKSCLSSSSSSGSSPASAKSSDGDGSSPRKRVHFNSPPPASQVDEDRTPTSSPSSRALDPPSSPPAASAIPSMIDIVALTKKKLKSPRKRVIPRAADGSTLIVRDGGKAVKKLEGLTVPKPFAFGAVRSVSSISSGLSSVAEGKGKEKADGSMAKTGNGFMGPPALPRAFGAFASGSTSVVSAPKRASSVRGMSSSSSRTNLNALSQSSSSSSRILQAPPPLSSSTSSRPPPGKPSLPSSRSTCLLSTNANLKRASVPSSNAISAVSSLSSAASSRMPKYPSSLGSHPPPFKDRPQPSTARKTSVPVPTSAMQLPTPPPRAVSDPVAGLTSPAGGNKVTKAVATVASGVDRKGLSSEGRSAMAGLAESLAKMQVRRAAGGVANAAIGGAKRISPSSTMSNLSDAAQADMSTNHEVRLTAGARPSFPSSSTRVPVPPSNPPLSSSSTIQSEIPISTSSRRLSSNSLASSSNRRESSSSSEGDSSFTSVSLTSSKSTSSVATLATQVETDALKGVVAFVDVRTAEGDEAGGMFVEILRGLGAKVLVRPSDSVTHIIFKTGKTSTLAHYRKFVPAPDAADSLVREEMMALEDLVDLEGLTSKAPPPLHLVGIGWVIRCKEEKRRVSEIEYAVDLREQSTFQKRRKSMEPKQMRAMMEPPSVNSLAASVEKARRRSLLFAPRISSPLKRASFSAPPVEASDDENDNGGNNVLA